MKVAINDINHTASLAHIILTTALVTLFKDQIASFLTIAENMNSIDLSKTKETAHATGESNVFRADEVGNCLDVDTVMLQAPKSKNNYFQVPRYFDDTNNS